MCLSSPPSPLPQFSSSFIHLSISRRVKLYEPGRFQGFVLLKGEFFFCHCCLLRAGLWVSVKGLETIWDVTDAA